MEDDEKIPHDAHDDLINMIGEFMSANMTVSSIYRSHLVETMVARVYDEFGDEGLCDMMMKIDDRANWVSDIVLEGPELDEEMFKRHNLYDHDLIEKARRSKAMSELNKKIWRLRRKYARLIVDEVASLNNPGPTKKDPLL